MDCTPKNDDVSLSWDPLGSEMVVRSSFGKIKDCNNSTDLINRFQELKGSENGENIGRAENELYDRPDVAHTNTSTPINTSSPPPFLDLNSSQNEIQNMILSVTTNRAPVTVAKMTGYLGTGAVPKSSNQYNVQTIRFAPHDGSIE